MQKNNDETLSRREFVKIGLASTAGIVLVACVPADVDETQLTYPTVTAPAGAIQLAPTNQCDDHDETLALQEGPFYKPETPQRTSFIEDGTKGTRLVVTGKVLTTDCQPIVGAVLDFWHADNGGNYDDKGFIFRGHQYTDANGDFRLETIVPGTYPVRTRHLHVKVDSPETTLLTTQLYFPADSRRNASDDLFDESLLLDITTDSNGEQAGKFNFVLA